MEKNEKSRSKRVGGWNWVGRAGNKGIQNMYKSGIEMGQKKTRVGWEGGRNKYIKKRKKCGWVGGKSCNRSVYRYFFCVGRREAEGPFFI